jgi:hypothetical protein
MGFPWVMILYGMLDVPSFDNPSSLDAVCLSDAPFVALSLNIHILLLLSSIAVGFLCYDLL